MLIRVDIMYRKDGVSIPPPHGLPGVVTVEAKDERSVTDDMVEKAVELRVTYRKVVLRPDEHLTFFYIVAQSQPK